MNEPLLYTGGALTILWDISHLFPTRQVVRGFGSITRDNASSACSPKTTTTALIDGLICSMRRRCVPLTS